MNNSLKEGVITAVLYLFILFLSIVIPILSLLVIFILPLPFVVYTAKHDWKPASLLFLIISLISIFFVSFPFVVLTILTGIIIGSAIHHKYSSYETWARGTLGFVIGLLFTFVFIQLIWNINIGDEINQAIEQSIEASEEILTPMGMEPTEENINIITEQMEQLINLLPVVIVAMSMFSSIIIQYLGYKLLNRIDNRDLRFPPFRNFQLPKVIFWIYFVAIIFSWINGDTNGIFSMAIMNVTMLTGLIISLQGYSLILYYTYKKGLSKLIPVISTLLIVLFPPIGLYMIRILGIIDIGFSLRQRITVDKK